MTYALPADMANRLQPRFLYQLSAESGTTPATTIIQTWLDQAYAALNARLGQRYVVPITDASWLLILREHELTGGAWFSWQYRGIGPDDEAAKVYLKNWESCLEWADGVGKGERDLPGCQLRLDTSINDALSPTLTYTSETAHFGPPDSTTWPSP